MRAFTALMRGAFRMLLSGGTLCAQDRWYMEQFTVSNGLPQNSVRSMAFDEMGYLWLTGEGGLVRYDGLRFKVFGASTDSAILEDRMGNLFASRTGELLTMDVLGMLYRIDDRGPRRLIDGRACAGTKHIAGSLPSSALFCSMESAGLRDPQWVRWEIWDDQVLALDTARWAVLGPTGLTCFDGDRRVRHVPLHAWPRRDFMHNNAVHVLERNGRIQRVDGTTGACTTVPFVGGPPPNAIERFYWSAAVDGVYALAADTLWELKEGEHGTLALRPLLTELPKGTTIQAVATSADGDNVFIGTSTKGLYRYRRMAFSTNVRERKADGGASNAFYAVVELDSHTVVTEDGWEADARGFRQGGLIPPLRDAVVMHRDPLERLWISRVDTIWILQPRTGATLNKFISPVGPITAYWQEGDTTWMAGRSGVVGYVRDQAVVHFQRRAGNFHELVFAMMRAPDGLLWLATGEGVLGLGTPGQPIVPIRGLQGIFARALYRDRDRMFVGTYGQGAYAVLDGRVIPFPLDESKDLLHVHAFVSTPNGWIWMPTNRGLYRIEEHALQRYLRDTTAVFQYAFHGPSSGVSTLEFNGGCSPAYAHLADGHLVLPTIDGLVWFRPQQIRDPWPRGQVRMDAVLVNGVRMDPAKHLPPLRTDALVDVEVSLPFWGDARNLLLRYRFVGLDATYSPVPSDGHIRVERLPAGRYTLQVLLPGADGGVQDLLRIEVQLPWYLRWWAIIAYAMLLMLLGWRLTLWRYRSILRRKEELERIVGERTDQLQKSNVALRNEGEVKERLMRILSHDIVAPLKAIARVGKQGTDQERPWTDTEMRAAFADMSAASFQLHDSASNLLNWIKHQGGSVQVRKQVVALHDFVEEVMARSSEAAKQQAVQLVNAVEEEMLVSSDPDLLAIILHNLVSNAVKHAPNAQVRISAEPLANGFRITVADNGPGMPEVSLQRVRDLLEGRGRSTELRSGLGYVIIADMAGLIGGTVRVENANGTLATLEVVTEVR